MNLTPAEQAALDSLAPRSGFRVGTVIHGFETREGQVLLTIPVPIGPEYAIGDRITITLEENR